MQVNRSTPPEREVTPDQAIYRALAHCSERGLKVTFDTLGGEYKTFFCHLYAPGGHNSFGMGKGPGLEGKSSAIFEALEHFYHETELVCARGVIFDRKKLELSNLNNGSPLLERIVGDRKILLSCLDYESTSLGEASTLYPACLANPDYITRSPLEAKCLRETGLMRYSSNSGTASGSSWAEAALHGCLELIERDAVSIALLQSVVCKSAVPVRVLDARSLPSELTEMYQIIERDAGGRICIFDITNDIGVPAVLARLSIDRSGLNYFGSGASLSPVHAVKRACLEALQVLHGEAFYELRRPKQYTAEATNFPAYLRCCLDAGLFKYRNGEVVVSYERYASGLWGKDIFHLEPLQQFRILVDRLSNLDICSFFRTIFVSHDRGISIVQIIAPKLERFHLVSHGVLVAPGARGAAVLSALESNGPRRKRAEFLELPD